MRRTALMIAACAALSACDRPPDLLGDRAPEVAAAPYPKLLPLDALVAATPPPAPADPAAGTEARAAALNARAAALRALPEG